MDYEEELFRVVTHSSDEDEVLDMLNENWSSVEFHKYL
jgi:hypothetical protein